MTLSEFTTWANGQSLPKYNDGLYRGECVSLINNYCWRVLNVPAGAWGNAKDWASNGTALKYFTKVSGTPQRGDVLVYPGTASNPYGHIEIYLGNNQSLQQNRFLDRKTHVSTIWPGYFAILRPNNFKEDSPVAVIDTITSMYWRLLGRAPDANGLNHHSTNAGKLGLEFVYNDMKNSAEGQADWNRRNPDRVASLERALGDKDAVIAQLQVALTNSENKPPKEVIKIVEKIVNVPVEVIKEVPVYTHDVETKRMITTIYNYFAGQYATFKKYITKG